MSFFINKRQNKALSKNPGATEKNFPAQSARSLNVAGPSHELRVVKTSDHAGCAALSQGAHRLW